MICKEYQNKKVARNRANGAPEAVDSHIGRRVRRRRTLLGISQVELVEALGLTFQQLQKYKRGANRISAGRLHFISDILGVPINYFFDGILPSFNKAQQKLVCRRR